MNLSRRNLFAAASAAGIASAVRIPVARAQIATAATSGAMQSDLALLQRVFETIHPGLNRYLKPGEFGQKIAAAQRWAAGGRRLDQFYVAISRLTASVQCGHTYANPNNQTRRITQALFAGRDRVPFSFRWIEGSLIITGGRNGPAPFPPGAEVLRVDGTESARLLRAMLPLTRADGANDAKRIAQLGVDARDHFAAFDVFRPMLFPTPGDGTVSLEVRHKDGAKQTIVLPALTESDVDAGRKASLGEDLGWTLNVRPDGIAVLTMPDWVTYRSKWDWQGFLDRAMDRLIDENIGKLIIDIRGNEGGTECGWHLLERLVDRPIELPVFARRTRYRAVPADLNAVLDTWNNEFRDWGAAARGPDTRGFYDLSRPGTDERVIKPRGRRYAGAIVLLADSTCSSATHQFAGAVKAARVAQFVGEPTGGNLRGINGDGYFFLRLPGTGIEVDVPLVGHFPAGTVPNAGVTPDHLVTVARKDIASGYDRQMAKAIAILTKQ